MKKRMFALTLALSLLLTSCGGGGGAKAATMHLRKTEGTVGVSDDGGQAVEPREELGLFSGYGVDTQSKSYAWIDLDDVKLSFEEDAVEAIAKMAMERKTGARGLRSIMEKAMMDVMYEIPSDETIEECIITKSAVEGKSGPLVIHRGERLREAN